MTADSASSGRRRQDFHGPAGLVNLLAKVAVCGVETSTENGVFFSVRYSWKRVKLFRIGRRPEKAVPRMGYFCAAFRFVIGGFIPIKRPARVKKNMDSEAVPARFIVFYTQ